MIGRTAATLGLLLGLGVAAFGAIAWAVTAATGTLSPEQRRLFLGAMVVGVVGALACAAALLRQGPRAPR